jgi:hypothetical protein
MLLLFQGLLLRTAKAKMGIFPSRKRVAAIRHSQVRFPTEASRLVAEAFDAVPTAFGRLVLAACLLHRDMGLYVCPLASIAYGYKEFSFLLADKHRKLLGTWLAMTADRQISDLRSYLWSVGDDGNSLAGSMLHRRSYEALLPIDVDTGDRKIFMKALGHALRTLRGARQPVVVGRRS